jgi:hypothetical protein
MYLLNILIYLYGFRSGVGRPKFVTGPGPISPISDPVCHNRVIGSRPNALAKFSFTYKSTFQFLNLNITVSLKY